MFCSNDHLQSEFGPKDPIFVPNGEKKVMNSNLAIHNYRCHLFDLRARKWK